VAHPRANGQVERANGLIIDGLKKRIYDANSKKGGKWIHELPHVIWGLRTQPSKATGQTPFFLVYGSEAILPADIMWKFPRVEMYKEGEADEARQLELDCVEEARCSALVQSARYLQGIRRYHDRNIKERSFSIGDLVLHRVQDESGLHKLNSRWEGPFIVKRVTRPGSYQLHCQEGYKTGILSTSAPRWSGCTQLVEHPASATILPLSRLVSNFCMRQWQVLLFWVDLAALCHTTRNVNS
jgi:hypothetical protein